MKKKSNNQLVLNNLDYGVFKFEWNHEDFVFLYELN